MFHEAIQQNKSGTFFLRTKVYTVKLLIEAGSDMVLDSGQSP